jgi:hypothetical protein
MIPELSHQEFVAHYRKKLLEIQEAAKKEEQIELPVYHDFTPGLYLRRIFMAAGTFVIGKTHKTEHFNIVLMGAANVMIDGEIHRIEAPAVFKSGAGVKKVLYILEDMVWMTTHPTEETDIKKLEELFVYSDEEEKILVEKEIAKYELRDKEEDKERGERIKGNEERNQKIEAPK